MKRLLLVLYLLVSPSYELFAWSNPFKRHTQNYTELFGQGAILMYDTRRSISVEGDSIRIPIGLIIPDHDYVFCMTLDVNMSAIYVQEDKGHTKFFEQEAVCTIKGSLSSARSDVICNIRAEREDIERLVKTLKAARAYNREVNDLLCM